MEVPYTTGLPGPLHGHPPPLRRGGLGAPERGGCMKRYPTDTPALRTACCGLCPLALPRGPRTPFSGRQVARLVHDELPPERERRFHLSAVAFPLGPRPGRKTWPYPVGSQKMGGLGGGEKEGGLVRDRGVFINVRRNSPSHVGGRAPGRLLRCGLWAALSWLRPRPGHQETNQGPVLPGPPGGPQ